MGHRGRIGHVQDPSVKPFCPKPGRFATSRPSVAPAPHRGYNGFSKPNLVHGYGVDPRCRRNHNAAVPRGCASGQPDRPQLERRQISSTTAWPRWSGRPTRTASSSWWTTAPPTDRPKLLRAWAARLSPSKLSVLDENTGFCRGNNLGFARGPGRVDRSVQQRRGGRPALARGAGRARAAGRADRHAGRQDPLPRAGRRHRQGRPPDLLGRPEPRPRHHGA